MLQTEISMVQNNKTRPNRKGEYLNNITKWVIYFLLYMPKVVHNKAKRENKEFHRCMVCSPHSGQCVHILEQN